MTRKSSFFTKPSAIRLSIAPEANVRGRTTATSMVGGATLESCKAIDEVLVALSDGAIPGLVRALEEVADVRAQTVERLYELPLGAVRLHLTDAAQELLHHVALALNFTLPTPLSALRIACGRF